MWFLRAFLYFIEVMLRRLQNMAGRQSCTGAEVRFMEVFLYYICHLMETRRCRPTVPDMEKMSWCSELQSASQRERRPEETTLTCVNDFADVCWGQRKATFIVITEAALCWSRLRCIFFFLFFFHPGAQRFWLHVLTKCLPPHKPTCQHANVSLRSRTHVCRSVLSTSTHSREQTKTKTAIPTTPQEYP